VFAPNGAEILEGDLIFNGVCPRCAAKARAPREALVESGDVA
jgi:hypothetical protein